jgi:uncharacterized protein
MKHLSLILLLLFSTTCWSADWAKGYAAFKGGDYATALKEWTPLAKQGHAIAQFNLGFMYANGEGVKQDKFKAVELYTKACDGGNAGGCIILGFNYESGEGVKLDKKRALALYGKACDLKGELGCKNYARLKGQGH